MPLLHLGYLQAVCSRARATNQLARNAPAGSLGHGVPAGTHLLVLSPPRDVSWRNAVRSLVHLMLSSLPLECTNAIAGSQ